MWSAQVRVDKMDIKNGQRHTSKTPVSLLTISEDIYQRDVCSIGSKNQTFGLDTTNGSLY